MENEILLQVILWNQLNSKPLVTSDDHVHASLVGTTDVTEPLAAIKIKT